MTRIVMAAVLTAGAVALGAFGACIADMPRPAHVAVQLAAVPMLLWVASAIVHGRTRRADALD